MCSQVLEKTPRWKNTFHSDRLETLKKNTVTWNFVGLPTQTHKNKTWPFESLCFIQEGILYLSKSIAANKRKPSQPFVI